MGLQTFYDAGPHPLLWPRSRAARGKVTVSDIPKCLNYCKIYIMYTNHTRGRGPHNTTWRAVSNRRAAVWRPIFLQSQVSSMFFNCFISVETDVFAR